MQGKGKEAVVCTKKEVKTEETSEEEEDEVLKIAKYHYTNKNYKLPYEFAMQKVVL